VASIHDISDPIHTEPAVDAAAQLNASLSGRYTIEREIGRGGMATVYRARDVRHDRLVALKVLSPELAALLGAERFLSEIRVTAKLQHPHILPLFDSGRAEAQLYYVMPYVATESLRARLDRERLLPIEEALRIAREVAGALEYAHRQGVIHRDIKPENILLQDGTALVADFGIALAVSVAGGERITQTGLSLGTPQYMSPEQAMGEKSLDARTDIYALGAVCYEMLAGEPPFTGPTLPAIVARVMTEAPRPITAQRHTVSAALESAVFRALEKLPADRFGSASEFAGALATATTAAVPVEPPRALRSGFAEPTRGSSIRSWIPWAVASAATLVAIWSLTRPSSPPAIHESLLELDASPLTQIAGPASAGSAVLSPDGSTFATIGLTPDGPRIHVRRFDDPLWRILPEQYFVVALGFSPDGSQLAYVRRAPGSAELMIARPDGSGASRLAEIALDSAPRGRIAWTPRGIVMSAPTGLVLVSPEGTVRQLTRGSGGFPHLVPSWIRSRDAILYSIPAVRGGRPAVGAVRLTDTAGTVLTSDAVAAVAGYNDVVVLVDVDGNLSAQRLAAALTLEGNAEALGVTAQYAFQVPYLVSDGSGTLVFAPSEDDAGGRQLTVVDRSGRVLDRYAPTPTETEPRAGPRFSPDRNRIALEMGTPGQAASDIWVYNRTSKTALRLTTSPVANSWPSWTPDGRTIVYSAHPDTTGASQALFSIPADGSGNARLVRQAPEQQRDGDWTPDGKGYVMRRRAADGSGDAGDIVLLTFTDSEVHERAILATSASELHPDVSPDGRFLAYASDETGRHEVYVTPLPGPGSRVRVSQSGGRSPRWTRDGGELVYVQQGSFWTARMNLSGSEPQVIQRDSLMRVEGAGLQRLTMATPYDVTPDGEQFAVLTVPVARRIMVWQGWQKRLTTGAVSAGRRRE
jgi:serine/threonine-protein kinase